MLKAALVSVRSSSTLRQAVRVIFVQMLASHFLYFIYFMFMLSSLLIVDSSKIIQSNNNVGPENECLILEYFD